MPYVNHSSWLWKQRRRHNTQAGIQPKVLAESLSIVTRTGITFQLVEWNGKTVARRSPNRSAISKRAAEGRVDGRGLPILCLASHLLSFEFYRQYNGTYCAMATQGKMPPPDKRLGPPYNLTTHKKPGAAIDSGAEIYTACRSLAGYGCESKGQMRPWCFPVPAHA